MTTEMAVIILKQSKFPKEQAEAIDALLKAVDVHLVGRILEKELAASRESRILSAVPSEEIARITCEKEIKEQGDYPIAGLSVRSPHNFFRAGWWSCYLWMKDEITKRGIAG